MPPQDFFVPQIFNDAFKTSGYREGLQYVRSDISADRNRRNRPRKIIWFNPPYSVNVQTNVARSFLCLIDKHFPRSHSLHKIFNRNNVTVSYSCMSNMAKIIKSHNAKILGKADTTPRQTSNAIAERKTFALSMARALQTTSYTRPLSLPHPVTQESTLAWRSIVSRRGSTTTRFPSSTANTHMTLSYPNTSAISRTATPISQSSGRLSRVRDLTGETRHAVICAWWKSSAFYPLTNQHFSTRDLSW